MLAKDLLRYTRTPEEFTCAQLRPAVSFRSRNRSKCVGDFRANRSTIAIVVDE